MKAIIEVARRGSITIQPPREWPLVHLHRVLSGTSGISPEMAVRLGKFCGNGPDLWLRMQQGYDLWHAEERLRGELKKIPSRGAG